jgi:hypothetical protein
MDAGALPSAPRHYPRHTRLSASRVRTGGNPLAFSTMSVVSTLRSTDGGLIEGIVSAHATLAERLSS